MRDVPLVIQFGIIIVRGIGCGVRHGARGVWSLPTLHFPFWRTSTSKLERQKWGWSPARLSVGGIAPEEAVMGSIAHGCSSLQGGGSNSRNMAHWRQIVTGSSGTRWVLTEPPPGCFCEFSLQLILFFSTTFSVTAFFFSIEEMNSPKSITAIFSKGLCQNY